MNFASGEIAGMLKEYQTERQVEMNIEEIAEKIHELTSGYPFLVSKLCKIVDEDLMPLNAVSKWDISDVEKAAYIFSKQDDANLNQLTKRLSDYEDLKELVCDMILEHQDYDYNIQDVVIRMGVTHGIFKNNLNLIQEPKLRIHNRIYREVIYNLLTSEMQRKVATNGHNIQSNFLTPDGGLDFEKVLTEFQIFLKENYSFKDAKFLERNGRLVFLAFLKPILNGHGFDFKEPQISDEKRIDVIATFDDKKFIIELKLWYDNPRHQRGLLQLADYLEQQNQDKGYLLIFNFNKKKQWKHERLTVEGKKIFAVWV
jgi:hypothetical protein